MIKKFFKCLSLLMVLTLAVFGTAAARSKAEITNIKACDINDEILRIEISYKGDLKTDEITTRTTGNILSVSMENTTPGRISKTSGSKIESDLIQKVTVKHLETGRTIT